MTLGASAYRPDGRRLNPAAFDTATPLPAGRQGTLGRNVLRGFPVSQLALSRHRQFKLPEKLNIQFRAAAFNLLNHPNFANPTSILQSVALISSPRKPR